MDSEFNGGRPVLTISASNLVEEHDKEVVITYRFPKHKMVIEPLMLVGAFFLLFVFCSVIARTQSISARGLKSKTSEKQLSDAAEKSKSD